VKKLLIVLGLVGAGIAGGAYWYAQKRNVAPGLPRTEEVDRGPIVAKVASGSGKFAPVGLVYITTDVAAGKIAKIHPGVEVGRPVYKEQPLIDLDDTLVGLQFQRAEAELAAARLEKATADLKRVEVLDKHKEAELAVARGEKAVEALRGTGGEEAAKEKLQQAKLALESAKSGLKVVDAGIEAAKKKVEALEVAVKAAQAAVNQTKIVSPVEGTIIDKKVIDKQLITPQATPILLIIAPKLEEMELTAQIGESDINKVEPGMEVQFTADAFAEKNWTFKGRVRRVAETPTSSGLRIPGLPELLGNAAGPVTYAVTVGDIQYPEGWGSNRFRNGMTANVDVVKTLVAKPVLRVPNTALAYRPAAKHLKPEDKQALEQRGNGDEKPVWIWENGKSRLVFIKIDAAANDGLRTSVTEPSELKEGTRVVTEDPPEPTRGGLFESPVKVGP
jgi:hypothetical protein